MTTVQLSTGDEVEGAKAAAAEANPNKQTQNQAQRPAELEGTDFKDAAALRAAYDELRKKMSQGGAPKDEKQTPDPKAGEQKQEQQQQETEQVFTALTTMGLDPKAFSAEIAKDGKLSEASYTALAAKGFPKAVVDQYIRGAQAAQAQNDITTAQNAKVELEFKTIMSEIGGGDAKAGEQAFETATAWASQALTDAEMEAYNGMVQSQNPEVRKQGANWLIQKYTAANPSKPKLIGGKTVGVASGDVYASDAEVTAAVRNPLYKKSAAFRAEHAAKLARSKNILTGAQYRYAR